MLQLSSGNILNKNVIVTGKGEVYPEQFNAKALIGEVSSYRKMDIFSKYAMAAARLAVQDAKLVPPEEGGIILSSYWGGLTSVKEFIESIAEAGPHLASAFLFPGTVMNAAAGYISIEYKMKGPTATLVGELDLAVRYAVDLISDGKSPVLLAGHVGEASDIVGVPHIGGVFYLLEDLNFARKRGLDV